MNDTPPMTPEKERPSVRGRRSLSDDPYSARTYRRGLSPPPLRREPSQYLCTISKQELCQRRSYASNDVFRVEETKEKEKDATETEVAGPGREAKGQTK